ncbi:hypothetical protein C2E25_10020 [Geothermobacter hydrogeniphilus]|uniref:Type I restriction modification DNA specificity domain-containing protein n=1 Tax=Geothermobacter hydrogeniphilus TaxID=1969733 RepID=A0A2K2H9C5_9BACT|nr:restriction endonuclease subunit S [Geothermobacter hydrogeniphilus]PNU19877.1 hypothetical protein C2E25_10020 [Geothermobacter hydrogeniphilus]
MGSEWQELPFTEAVQVNPKIKLKKGERYPFVEMKAIDPSWRSVAESEYRTFKSGGARFEPYDTLLARITPCLENGKIARYAPTNGSDGPAFGSTEFIVIRGKDGITDNNFAYYLTKWQDFRQFAISQMTGSSGRQRVPAGSLGAFYVPIPELPEQRAIAHILGSLDDKIELNRRMNETLEAMASALFKSWFIDFDPVIDNALAAGNPIPEDLQPRAALRESLGDARKPLPDDIRDLFPCEFEFTEEMGWIPKGWNLDILDTLTSELRRGISPKYTEQAGIRVINQRCIRNHAIDYSFARRNDEKQRKVDGRLLEKGDLLVNSTGVGTLGRMAQVIFIDEPTVVDSHVTVVRAASEKYKPYTFSRMMLSLEPTVEAMGEGSTGQTELSRTILANMKAIVPPLEIQELVENNFLDIAEKVSVNTRYNEALAETRDTLLPKLLLGEIRIPEAEKLVEASV